jgi:uncharacterized membrane protein (DUF485 family)
MNAEANALIEKVKRDPEFHALVRRRSAFAWTLSALMVAIYFGFILVVAFAPHLLAIPLGEGWTTTIGIPIGVGIITLFWLLTGYYVHRANKEFDVTNVKILRESEK